MLRPWTLLLKERAGIAPDSPRYMQIAHGLIHEIERGRLLPGDYLPSSRDLAEALSVNRKTIVTAYEELVAQGWLMSAGTRGTMVSQSLPRNEAVDAARLPSPASVAAYDAEFPFLAAPDRPIAVPVGHWRKAATIGSAEVIGHSDDVGSLEPGKFADLLILNADPLADLANAMKIDTVMKNGRIYDPMTLDEIWPRTVKEPDSWFAQDATATINQP